MFQLKSSNAAARRKQVLAESLDEIKALNELNKAFQQQQDDPEKAGQAMKAFGESAGELAEEFDEYVKTHVCCYCKTPN
jgi:type II secretory pathway component PulF